MLADQIKLAAQREAVAKLDAGEVAIKAQVVAELGEPFIELNGAERELVTRWASWCEVSSLRRNPAKPATVARWVLLNRNNPHSVLEMLAAIEKLHALNGLSNPVATPIVGRALESVLKIEPPRSWHTKDKAAFAMLPVQMREIIANHERRREKELRRGQNELADLRKQQQAAAEPKPAEQHKETVS
jgi:hypothetical protein